MEINEYVRTKDGKIGKYIQPELGKPNITNGISFNEGANYGKHSKDIIDLVEVGDIIEFKEDNDLYRVNCIPNEECGCNCFYLEFNYAEKYCVEDIMVDKEYMKTYLKSVLTKEQFEANAYKIEKEV